MNVADAVELLHKFEDAGHDSQAFWRSAEDRAASLRERDAAFDLLFSLLVEERS
jgi:hypothetical protein